ncbi:hypothetical protein [Pseudemcibacter aquimaris]|uniref:hypothetical protein n=1 Tax=Pseudemcibacter aquimaris TaxID=2857064 RepID=UPI00237D8613|nr:hypothetical protein [Pseudemcibacter aquimaris]MCC3859906.1 hypothetical protein [Pseudemcibacter aquimaris]WDU57238.1 hypothetical protein KW060_08510 [Pseudemcibacter aquimaris]
MKSQAVNLVIQPCSFTLSLHLPGHVISIFHRVQILSPDAQHTSGRDNWAAVCTDGVRITIVGDRRNCFFTYFIFELNK